MKVTSKAQFRYFSQVAAGVIQNPALSPEKAKAAIQGVNPNNLPDRSSPNYPTRLTVKDAKIIN